MISILPAFRSVVKQFGFQQAANSVNQKQLKKFRRLLRKKDRILKLFVEHSPAAIAMLDKEMRYMVTSRRYLIDYEIPLPDVTGKLHYDIFPEIPERWKEIHKKCLNGAVEKSEKDLFWRENGRPDWVKWEIRPWYDEFGQVGGIIIFSEVITERIIAESALLKSEQLFNKAFHNNASAMFIARTNNDSIVEANPLFFGLTGAGTNHINETPLPEIIGCDRQNWRTLKDELSMKGILQNIELKLQNGSRELFSLLSLEKINIMSEECYIGTMLDITPRKLAEIELQEKNEEIEAQNEEYFQLNEQLMDVNEELEVAKERAEESDRLKTAFLHNISHEIRTPMNAILGFVSLLQNPSLADDKRNRYCEIIDQSSKQLLSIINDIIDIAAIEAGQAKLYMSGVKLNDLMAFLYAQFQLAAENKSLSFRYSTPLPDNKAVIITDETKLIQVLSNLIGNALKFTLTGSVSFGYLYKKPHMEFFVEDTGIGIPADMQKKIFNRFHQVESARASHFGGSGLGLSISKGYVELMGGKIWVESEEGKGSVFRFQLPCAGMVD